MACEHAACFPESAGDGAGGVPPYPKWLRDVPEPDYRRIGEGVRMAGRIDVATERAAFTPRHPQPPAPTWPEAVDVVRHWVHSFEAHLDSGAVMSQIPLRHTIPKYERELR